jgi:hypothetical protein
MARSAQFERLAITLLSFLVANAGRASAVKGKKTPFMEVDDLTPLASSVLFETVSQGKVAQALGIMKKCGLVEAENPGCWRPTALGRFAVSDGRLSLAECGLANAIFKEELQGDYAKIRAQVRGGASLNDHDKWLLAHGPDSPEWYRSESIWPGQAEKNKASGWKSVDDARMAGLEGQ